MNNHKNSIRFVAIVFTVLMGINVCAQQWIKEMPGYERYKEIAPQIRTSVKPGQISVKWADDGKSLILPKELNHCTIVRISIKTG